MEKELLIVAFFAVLALAHHHVHHRVVHQLTTHSGIIAAAMSHPAILDTIRDYMIHFVVYSGYIFHH